MFIRARSNSGKDMNDRLGNYLLGKRVRYLVIRADYNPNKPGWELIRMTDPKPNWYKSNDPD